MFCFFRTRFTIFANSIENENSLWWVCRRLLSPVHNASLETSFLIFSKGMSDSANLEILDVGLACQNRFSSVIRGSLALVLVVRGDALVTPPCYLSLVLHRFYTTRKVVTHIFTGPINSRLTEFARIWSNFIVEEDLAFSDGIFDMFLKVVTSCEVTSLAPLSKHHDRTLNYVSIPTLLYQFQPNYGTFSKFCSIPWFTDSGPCMC